MLPYGLNQEVEFKKNFGPILGDLKLGEMLSLEEDDFTKKINPIYQAIKIQNLSELVMLHICRNKTIYMEF